MVSNGCCLHSTNYLPVQSPTELTTVPAESPDIQKIELKYLSIQEYRQLRELMEEAYAVLPWRQS